MDLCGDNRFGPQVADPSCRGGFDFTLFFEETIFTIGPSSLLLLSVPWRLAQLYRSRIKVSKSALHISKITAIGIYACLQLALLTLWSKSAAPTTKATIASACLNLISAIAIGVLSHFEHLRAASPSIIVNTYLFCTLFLDIARARTQWLIPHPGAAVAPIFTVAVVLKAVILVLEATEKGRILLAPYRNLSIEQKSSMFNRGVFWWLNGLLISGSKRVLAPEDLFKIDEALDSTAIGTSIQANWRNSKKTKYALIISVVKSLRWPLISIIFPRLCGIALALAQPFLVQRALQFVSEPVTPESTNVGYGLIGGYGLVYIGTAITTGWYEHQIYRAITMIRGGMIYLIYNKMIELKVGNVSESAAMTLMSTDVEQIARVMKTSTDIWANLLQMGAAIVLLERQLGIASLAPVVIAVFFSAITMYAGKQIAPSQKAWFEAVQTRVNMTSETLSSMKGVKFTGLTDKVTQLIQFLRTKELSISRKYRKLRVLTVFIANLPSTISAVVTFAVYAVVQRANGGSLDIDKAFTSLSILTLLETPIFGFIYSIPDINAALGCFRRIQDYLMEESRDDHRLLLSARDSPEQLPSTDIEMKFLRPQIIPPVYKESIVVQNGSFAWSADGPPILRDINITLDKRFTIIVGTIGSGKSTLVKALLGETPSSKGFVYVSSLEMAFCDQTCWIINGTIRDNILGASEYEQDWYNSVVKACELETDFDLLEYGDQTMVGSNGITLSGGQKQRISIARAVYSRKRIAIFDDVLSGLDAGTQEAIFNNVFGPNGLLSKIQTMVILVTHSVHRAPSADHIIALENGEIVEQGSFAELNSTGGYVAKLNLQDKAIQEATESETSSSSKTKVISVISQSQNANQDLARQTGDFSIYNYYIKSIGTWRLVLFLALVGINAVAWTLQSLWLNWWSSANETHPGERLGYWLGIYGLLAGLGAVAMLCCVYHMTLNIVLVSAKRLHWNILTAAMRAPLSFFTKTDVGTTTNRFSQDMQMVDLTLPSAVINCTFQLASVIGMAILTCLATKYLAVLLPFIATILFFVQRFYLLTSRQLRLMELEAKSPLYTHFIESLSGLVTLRGYGWSAYAMQKNIQLLDRSQQPYYLLFSIQRWLTLVLDMIVAGIAIVLMGLTVKLKDTINAGLLGVAMVNIMQFGQILSLLITFWTQLETSLGAIARIKAFSLETPSEDLPTEVQAVSEAWPSQGTVEFKNIVASYSPEASPVLKDVNISIKPGQKVGIVGRTGSGKSSLLLTLFRMLDFSSGSILIDGVDISTIPRQEIRSRLIALPQDPFFLSGTVRSNADPMGLMDDDSIMTALKKTGIWEVIETKGGLDADMHAEFLSHGQRQLFCLARAMLRKSRILVLDEAMSSVDVNTEKIMERLIREEFSGYTIIAVSHRLEGLLDFDKVAVLDKGRLVDFDSPNALLARPGIFKDLYSALG
ncbi:P-loop containing nucleoside triphosphate hydrolase protein [Xylogone sp. PMI_703]|nr:P-loop containing nucleoside triphosphate hydrolase protein [Xylogone sp. PMI_703]